MLAAQTVALVGPSGGGKSSVVKLLQRFYVPSGGSLRLDGRDLGLYEPKWLKRHIGFVSQEPTLYNRSIRRRAPPSACLPVCTAMRAVRMRASVRVCSSGWALAGPSHF